MGIPEGEGSSAPSLQCLDETMASDSVNALLEAARYADIDDLESLAGMGVSLDSQDPQGRTALHMAAANGHAEVVAYLIRNKVNVNATNLEKNTPLHWACLNGHSEVVRKLILAGADVGVLNSHEKTPLDEAVSTGKLEIVDVINSASTEAELDDVHVS